jgi:hypothetical protein
MLAATITDFLEYFGAIIGLVTFVAALAGAWILVQGTMGARLLSANQEALTGAQTMLQTQELRISDLERQLQTSQTEAVADARTAAATISSMQARITALEDTVTARALIRAGFEALGVPRETLDHVA